LDEANLLLLRSRTTALKGRSVSETLDDLVTQARTTGATPLAAIRSVVGSVDISDVDPNLEQADDYIRGLVNTSLTKPFLVRETAPPNRPGTRSRSKRRG
jgi:hypothetical protein